MALIKYASGEIPLNNEHSGYTFQAGRTGNVMFPAGRNNRTRYPIQWNRQQFNQRPTREWRNQSAGTVSNWESFAATYPQPTLKDPAVFLTGYQLFVKRNFWQLLNFGLQSDFMLSPVMESISEPDITFSLKLVAGQLLLFYTFSDYSANIIVQLFSTRVLSPGQLYVFSQPRYMGNIINLPPLTSLPNPLYNSWAANYSSGGETIAPTGWRVPNNTDYVTLRSSAGGISHGGALKSDNSVFWSSPNTGASNLFGFSAIGSGYRSTEGFFQLLKFVNPVSLANAVNKFFYFPYDSAGVFYGFGDYQYGGSVRFVKNDSINPGTVSDYDGNVYPTIQIGNQVWTARNYIGTHYNAGTPIPNLEADAAWAADTAGAFSYWLNNPASPFASENDSIDISELFTARFGLLPAIGDKIILKYLPMSLNSAQFFESKEIYLTVE